MAAAVTMGMNVLMRQDLDTCRHLYAVNDTMWLHARMFSYTSEAIIQPTIFSIGIMTNLLALVVIVGVKMNRIFRTCLVALTISDLCCTTVGLVQLLIEILFYCGNVPEGRLLVPVVINNALYMMFLMLISTSASLVVFIAFIRNMMYLKPMRARAFFTPKITKIACGVIVLWTVLMYAPTCLQVMWLACYKETADTSDYCRQINETIPNLKSIANGYLYFNVAFYGPVMLLIYMANFICIRVSLNQSAKDINKMTVHGNNGDRRTSTVTRITKMLSLILILDVICTLPSVIQSLGLLFEPEENLFEKKNLFFELIDVVAEIFLALRPTYNFWLYVFQRPEFRKRLRCLVKKTFRPFCRHTQCPCSEFFTDDKTVKQTTTSGNGTGSRDNINMTSTTRVTPPLQRIKLNMKCHASV